MSIGISKFLKTATLIFTSEEKRKVLCQSCDEPSHDKQSI